MSSAFFFIDLLSSPPTGYISPKVISSAALVISNPFTHFSFPFPSNTDPSHSVENSNTGDDNNSYNTAFDSRLQIIAGTLSATILILTSIVILMGCVILIIRRRSKTNSSSEGVFFHGKRQLDDNSCDNPLYAGGMEYYYFCIFMSVLILYPKVEQLCNQWTMNRWCQ